MFVSFGAASPLQLDIQALQLDIQAVHSAHVPGTAAVWQAVQTTGLVHALTPHLKVA